MKRRAVLVAVVAVVAACAPETPADQAARGAVVYREQCEVCHDVDGAIGARLSPRVIRAYGTPERLFDYLRVAMPYGAPGSLEPRDYWAVVAYLAAERGRHTLPLVLDATTAGTLSIPGEGPVP